MGTNREKLNRAFDTLANNEDTGRDHRLAILPALFFGSQIKHAAQWIEKKREEKEEVAREGTLFMHKILSFFSS